MKDKRTTHCWLGLRCWILPMLPREWTNASKGFSNDEANEVELKLLIARAI